MAVEAAKIIRSGPFIAVSGGNDNPLPQRVLRALESNLQYKFVKFLYGEDAFNQVTGERQTVKVEPRVLFQYDEHGRLVCQKGFESRVAKILRDNGFAGTVVDCNPPRVRPNCYVPDWDRVVREFEFRPLQDTCLEQVDMHDGGIIDAVTAFGKMWIIAMICVLYPQAKIDIVTRRKDVIKSLQRLLSRWVPSVGMVGGGRRKRGNRVTLYTAGSLHHSDHDADIVLADEVHELMTDKTAEVLTRYHYARMYGFTASKDTRADNAHERMEGIFGPTIFHLDYPTAERLGLVVPITVQWLDISMRVDPAAGCNTLVQKKRHGIWENQFRNHVIAQASRSLWSEGYQVLILVDTVTHALYLRQMLPEFTLCYAEGAADKVERRQELIDLGLLGPEEIMTADLREQRRQQFESRDLLGVIATGVWAVGVSFDGLNVLVRADGGESETANIQLPGRVCRTDPDTGKECGILLDCEDNFNPGFRDKTASRRRSYAKREWTQLSPTGRLWRPRRGIQA